MHLTNSSEPMIDPSSHYKMMDPSHDMLYYQVSKDHMYVSYRANDSYFSMYEWLRNIDAMKYPWFIVQKYE